MGAAQPVAASRSLGTYSQQVILQDAIDSQSFRTGSCVGTTLPVSHRPCIDINFTDPNVLVGDLTAQQRAFLFDTDIGKTKYNQNFIEGTLITPRQSAAVLIPHLAGDDTGAIWDASTVPVRS